MFASLAKEHSECASAKSGGDLGWLERGTYFPSFEEVVRETAVCVPFGEVPVNMQDIK